MKRDSSQNPQNTTPAAQNGPPPQLTEEEELRLVNLSSTQFFGGKYDACLQTLQQLGSARAKHNELVAKYYRHGCTPQATEGLLGGLTKLLDENQLASANYNCAVLNFHLQHYSKTFDILVKIFGHLEPFEEYLTMRSAFLLIETCLRMKILEKKTLQQALALLDKALPQLRNGSATPTGTNLETEPFEQEAGMPVPTPFEFKITLQNIKTRLYLIFHAFKSARNELKLLTDLQPQPETTTAFLKSHLEYLESNHIEAIKCLNIAKPTPDAPLENKIIYFNSLGCIHLKMGKFAAASFYFTKALEFNNKLLGPWATGEGDAVVPEDQEKHLQKKHAFAVDKSSSILYNFALSLLFRGKASLAFSCLQASLTCSYHRPHIWLRLGECCTVHYLKKKRKILRKKKQQVTEKQKEVPSHLFLQQLQQQSKNGRILLLDPDHDQYIKEKRSMPATVQPAGARIGGAKDPLVDLATPQICLSYGYSCFLNLIQLLNVTFHEPNETQPEKQKQSEDSEEQSDTTTNEDSNSTSEKPEKADPQPASEAAEKKRKGPNWEQWEKQKQNQLFLKLCATVNVAWIALQTHDPVVGLAHSRSALELCERLSSESPSPLVSRFEFLATIYYAEASVLTDHLQEAKDVLLKFLKKNEGKDIDVGLGLDLDPNVGWEFSGESEVSKPGKANVKCALYSNLATIHLMKGDLNAARNSCAAAKKENKDFIPVLVIELYVALASNELDLALQILTNEQFSPIEVPRGRPNK